MKLALLALLVSGALVLAAPAGASESGLDSLDLTPAVPPTDPGPAIRAIEEFPWFRAAVWDSAGGVFRAAVAESAHFEPRMVLQELRQKGYPMDRMTLHFAVAHGNLDLVRVVSEANDMKFGVVFTLNSRRFWGFLGRNPRGQQADMKLDGIVHLGKVDPATHTADIDSLEIVGFALTEPFHVTRKP